ncbi:mitogen-activated protein kinase [Hyaloscypha variabilis]
MYTTRNLPCADILRPEHEYPQGIRSFIATSANHYIAIIDGTTVLKFPIVPHEEQAEHPAEIQRFRSSIRAATVKGLEVEEQILHILGKHHRIIQLKGRHEDGLLLKYLPNGSIERYLRSNAPNTTIEGLAYIHMKNGRLLYPSGHVTLNRGAAKSDRKTDIFAFGIVLYFILTDELPFPELSVDDEEIERRFARQDFPPLKQLPGGDVIRNCWTGVYDDALGAMTDL